MLAPETRPEEQTSSLRYVTSPSPAAQAQVSPDELARALASLESRRDGHDGKLTIALGDALQQLGVAVSPEEALREIEALRLAERSDSRKCKAWPWLALAGLVVQVLCALMLAGLRAPNYSSAVTPAPATAAPAVPSLPSYVRLADVPDGMPVHCDFATLRDLADHGYDSSKVVDTRKSGSSSQLWTILKRDGRVLVRCWSSEIAALYAANGDPATVYASASRPAELASM